MQKLFRHTVGLPIALALFAWALALSSPAQAGGTLTLKGSPQAPIQILDHHVEVVIQNGFARTEVTQTFFNPNPTTQEATYRVPVPKDASLSEMTMYLGELTLEGEVVGKAEARQAFEEEKDNGAGVAEKNEGQVFDFHVSPIPAQGELRFRYLYYQPIEIDTGVGRFQYPLEDGGTDEVAKSFWTQETKVHRSFSFHAVIESAWPIQDVRMPGLASVATVKELGDGRWDILLEAPGGVDLTTDLIVYYRLADNLPGRVEMLAYKPDPNAPGTFMMIVTPGMDLQPLSRGVDYVFILDISGSMEGKFGTLADGVAQAIERLDPMDRFRIIAFSTSAQEITKGYRNATPKEVERAVKQVHAIQVGGSTNLYKGIGLGLKKVDADRATNVVLITDAVANEGIVNPKAFDKLMRSHDVRLFGFLLGNSANWPLMRTITEATGGYYASISNADDVIGQIMLAKSKVTHACLHDASLSISGVRTFDSDLGAIGKVYRGQQLVSFGRYSEGGKATVKLEARLTGEDKVYSTEFDFPQFTEQYPELERLWALDRIDSIKLDMDRGRSSEKEGGTAIRDLGIAYQIVTDETSMLVLRDEAFAQRGIERKNKERIVNERAAQIVRNTNPVTTSRVDTSQPAFKGNAPRLGGGGGGGGGAFGPWAAGLAVLLAAAGTRRHQPANLRGEEGKG
ncbi:MAG: VIT and VWA domain-containing protein [Planctomycetota bacterium]|nr:VIT and VWA domain-containing protein [Planctomycetota bacterium]